jgi:cytoskeletal protein CcmA (bactofilin family)
MWRKPAEAKPSSQSAEPSVSVSARPTPAIPVATQPDEPSSIAAVSSPAASVPTSSAPAPPSTSFGSVSSSAPAVRAISRISSGIRINGEISGNDDLYIDGQAEGQFRFPQSKVTVGPNGRVQASIEAREIVVEGTVQGNLKASESVQLGRASRVNGSLTTPRIAIDDGARLRGKVEMTRATETKQPASASRSAPAQTAPASPANVSPAPEVVAKTAGESA